MKTRDKIDKAIELLDKSLTDAKRRYNKLGQIDMQSEMGSKLLAQINNSEGKLEALNWVIDDDKILMVEA